jgi:hypothetical protein
MVTAKRKRVTARRNAAVHFKAGDRVRFKYGKREVEGTVTSTSGDRVHVEMHFSDDPVPGLFRESELNIA